MRILVVNAGSSSLKLSLLDPAGRTITASTVPDWQGEEHTEPISAFLDQITGAGGVDAAGHRIVHGGTRFRSAVRLDGTVLSALTDLTDLAPLHQPRALAGVAAVQRLLPGVPAVGCFDTAFHATLPPAAATYPVPVAWRQEWGLRRYGFHGLSHAYAAARAAELLDRPLAELRLVTCHLGAGASACAVLGGQSVDTTMGFTPMDGLVMATRPGSLDPGLLLWVQQHGGLTVSQVADALEHASGLAALNGGSADMRDVLVAAGRGEKRAALALDVYLHRLRREIAAMAAATHGLDALVFTGGVGEHAAEVRAAAVAGLAFLGLAADPDSNRRASADADVSTPGARARTLVVTAREDLEIARQVQELLT